MNMAETYFKMYEQDYMSLTEIAEACHVSLQVVSGCLTKAGYHVGHIPRSGSKDPRCRQRFLFLPIIQRHWSLKHIGEELGIAPAAVRKWMRVHGISKKEMIPAIREHSHSWKGGRCTSKQAKKGSAYVYITARDSGYLKLNPKWKHRWVPEHKLFIEKGLGALLPRGFVVHHIDGNGTNNALGNLAVLTWQQHRQIHGLMNWMTDKKRVADITRAWSKANSNYCRATC